MIRERAGVSQEAVARAVGVERPAISRWEAGLCTPRGKDLERYLAVLEQLAAEMTTSGGAADRVGGRDA